MTDITHTIGVLSGTSMDAIDAALVQFHGDSITLIDTVRHPIPTDLKMELQRLCHPGPDEINRMGACDHALGLEMAKAVIELLQRHPDTHIDAVGSHGQTIRHQPDGPHPFSCQIANPHLMAEQTGLRVIHDFRGRDIANGGQGAPLAPALHQDLFARNEQGVAVVNIGGMANITLLNGTHAQDTLGFDTGPGNCLMDAWVHKHRQQAMDQGGNWAREGTLQQALLDKCLSHPFFARQGSKSTGHESFHLPWLEGLLHDGLDAVDVQRTLLELTAQSIAKAIATSPFPIHQILICGGGAYNTFLMERLRACCQAPIQSTESVGVAPEWVEAVLFAWLANQHLNNQSTDLGRITGARKASILGVAVQP